MDLKYISLYLKEHKIPSDTPTVMTPVLAKLIEAHKGLSDEAPEEILSQPPRNWYPIDAGRQQTSNPLENLIGTCLVALASGATFAQVDAYCQANGGCTFGVLLAVYFITQANF